MQGKIAKPIHWDLTPVLAKGDISPNIVKRLCSPFTDGDCATDDHERQRRSFANVSNAMVPYLNNEPFISAKALAQRLATDH
jgi:hypothetical protein